MDLEQTMLTDAEKAYYRAWESMFESSGWRLFVDELAAETKTLPEDTFWQAKGYEEIVMARIRAALNNTIMNYPEIIAQRKANAIISKVALAEELAEGTRSNV